MVRLTKIYTKSGDRGTTMLGNGTVVPKHHVRVEAYGEVDETNAVLGLIVSLLSDNTASSPHSESRVEIRKELMQIQNDLFDVGADLCVPIESSEKTGQCLRITASQVNRLEQLIDRYNAELGDLESFVLPGGTSAAAHMHMARTVSRRAERRIAGLLETAPEQTNACAMVYMNRLSDLMFVMARFMNGRGGSDVLWKPGNSIDS